MASSGRDRDLVPLGLERGRQTRLLDRFHIGLIRTDLLLLDQLDQGVVQGEHAELLRRLDDRGDLERLPLADQVRDGGRGEQDLARGDAPAAQLLAQRLRDHALERLGQHHADLRLPVRRELVDHAVYGGCRCRRVQRTEHEVAGLRRLDGDGDGLQVAHLAHQHDVRVLPQGGSQRPLESLGVHTHLPLRDDALLVLVHEFDRVLDRDDVVRARAVDQIDQRAQRGGLPRAGRSGDEHETLLQVAELLHLLRDAELLHAHDFGRDHAEYGDRAFTIARRVHAEPSQPGDLVGEIRVPRLLPFAAVSLRHDRQQHELELLCGERRRALALHLAVRPEHGRLSDPQMQVGGSGMDQRLEQLAQRPLRPLELGRVQVGRHARRRLPPRVLRTGRLDHGCRGNRGRLRGTRWRCGGRRGGGSPAGGWPLGRRRACRRRGIPDRRHHRRQAPRVGHDPHAHHAAVRDVLELRLGHLVDMVGRLGRRHLDQEGVDVLIRERLPAHLAGLAVLHHGDRLVRQQVQLIPLLPEQHVDERIDPRGHELAQGTRVQHVRAIDVMGRRMGPHREEGVTGRVEVVEQARVVVGQLGAGPAPQLGAAHQDELDAEHPCGREPGRVGDRRLAIDRERDRLHLRDEQDVVVRRWPEREKAFRPVQELQDRLRTVVVRDPLHHEDLARLGRTLRHEQIRGDGRPWEREVGHGRIIRTSSEYVYARRVLSVRLTLDGHWLSPSTSNLLVHPARDRPTGSALRSFAGRLLGRPDGRGAVGPAAVLHTYAALHLGPSGRHKEEERCNSEHSSQGVERRALHAAKVVTAPRLSTRRHGCGRAVGRGPHRGTDAIHDALFCSQRPRCISAARGLQRHAPNPVIKEERHMRCVVFVLATLALVGCQDAMQPAQPATSLPLAQPGPGSYEVVNLGTIDRTNGFGGGGSWAWSVNARGQIVGWSRTGVGEPAPYGATHAFIWENGVMTDLGTLGGSSSRALYVNGSGQVAGWSGTASGDAHAFLSDGGVMRDLGTLGGTWSTPTGLSDAGLVVGSSGTAAGASHAFAWQDGVIQDLGTLGGGSSDATAANGAGQVVGSSETAAGDTHAFLWDAGLMRDLGTLGGTFSSAAAISEVGAVTGQSTDASGQSHAFLWKDGVMQDLGLLPGYVSSSGVSLNAAGAVAGEASNPQSFSDGGFFWAAGVMSDLGTLGGHNTHVAAVGPQGQVAGTSTRSNYRFNVRAFVWEDGMMHDLGALAGHDNAQAFGMNARGDVVGMSSRQYPGSDLYRAVLWRRFGGSPAAQSVASNR